MNKLVVWIFFFALLQSCAAAQCTRAQVALWKDAKETEYKYKITVRCHNDGGFQDVDVVKSKTKIVGCKGVSDGN